MAWIESHQALRDHPKTFELMGAMGWDLDTTIGKLHRLWWWCQDYAEDGDLRKHNDGRIAGGMGVAIVDSERLVKALVQACWLERQPYFRVHDWWDYIGPWLRSKYKRSPDKWERVRNLYLTVTQPLTNQPDQPTNQPKEMSVFSPKEAERHFEAVWSRYPSRTGRKAAFRHFLATVRTAEELSAIGRALESYMKSERVRKGFIQNGSTWFNDWQSWLDYKDPSEINRESREKQEMVAKDRESREKQDREKREKAERLAYEADVEKLKSLPDEEFDKIKKRACERLDKNRMLSDSLKTEMLEPEMVVVMRGLVQV